MTTPDTEHPTLRDQMADDRPISERLAARGIAHEEGDHSRRHLRFNGAIIGLASAQEAVNLLAMLDALLLRKEGEPS